MLNRSTILAALIPLGFALPAVAQNPLSAIDWLDRQPPESIDLGLVPDAAPQGLLREPPITVDATRPEVLVEPLDAPTVDAVGLLPSRVTGFPPTLWKASHGDHIADLIIAQNVDEQPAMQSLLFALLLAEALPPEGTDGRFLLARIDRLISLGAVAQAAELLAMTDAVTNPALFARVLDLSLLSGPGNAACEALVAAPHLAPEPGAFVYCLALTGHWDDAYTLLEASYALDQITTTRYGLLLTFLEPELAEDLPSLPPSNPLSPLEFRLRDASGEPVPTASLPRAFANADLSGDSGWKAQIEAAERLVRGGALAEGRLFAAYTLSRPSASGGVWDRAEAVQRFETALESRDPVAVGNSLGRVWPVIAEAGLQTAFAKEYAGALAAMPLTGTAAGIKLQVALLSPEYETLSRGHAPTALSLKYAIALAQGTPAAAAAPSSQARAITEGFHSPPPDTMTALLNEGKLGEVILRAMSLAYQGHLGDESALTAALATFRAVGLEDTARRTALQTLLLTAES